MEALRDIDSVRKRPGMYVGDTERGAGLVHLVLEILANAYELHLAGRCSKVSLDIAADGMITVEDDGPGMPVKGGEGLPPLDVLLTTFSDRQWVGVLREGRPAGDRAGSDSRGHRPHIELGGGGLGLFIVNALSDRFEISTVCNGVESKVTYARGKVIEPLASAASTRASGTTVRFRPDPSIFLHCRVPRVELTRELEDLSFLAPRLQLKWSIAGDEAATHGLVARVALDLPCAFDAVAGHRGTYETTNGPIDVDVALGWRTTDEEPRIESFVNFHRSPGNGTHVDGLFGGIAAFVGNKKRSEHGKGLVAAIAVVLTDVMYGTSTRDRLITPAARSRVASATSTALDTWAATHRKASNALRKRLR